MHQASTKRTSSILLLIASARPKTLIASILPVTLGALLALQKHSFSWGPFLSILCFALLIQIGTNMTNDYFDLQQGADSKERKGPLRALHYHSFSPRLYLNLCHLIFFLSLCAISPVLIAMSWQFSALALLCVALGYLYTASKYSLAYLGIAEPFSFLFFGILPTSVCFYVLTGSWSLASFLWGASCGFFSLALLTINNLRDEKEDALAGKKTLIVRFGSSFGKYLFTFSLLGGTCCLITPLSLARPLYLWVLFGFILARAWFLSIENYLAKTSLEHLYILPKVAKMYLLSMVYCLSILCL